MSTAELLALLLGPGPHKSARISATACWRQRGLATADCRNPVAALTGFLAWNARAVAIHAAPSLVAAWPGRSDSRGRRPVPRDVVQWYAPRMEDLPVEEFHVAVLDAQHRLERALP